MKKRREPSEDMEKKKVMVEIGGGGDSGAADTRERYKIILLIFYANSSIFQRISFPIKLFFRTSFISHWDLFFCWFLFFFAHSIRTRELLSPAHIFLLYSPTASRCPSLIVCFVLVAHLYSPLYIYFVTFLSEKVFFFFSTLFHRRVPSSS